MCISFRTTSWRIYTCTWVGSKASKTVIYHLERILINTSEFLRNCILLHPSLKNRMVWAHLKPRFSAWKQIRPEFLAQLQLCQGLKHRMFWLSLKHRFSVWKQIRATLIQSDTLVHTRAVWLAAGGTFITRGCHWTKPPENTFPIISSPCD